MDAIRKAYPEIRDSAYYVEQYTGTTQQRPRWIALLRKVQPGDTIVFDSISRMSRDAAEGVKQYEELQQRGISLVFLNERYCDTDTYKAAASKSIPETGNQIADIYIEATNRVIQILARRQIAIAFEQAQKETDDLHKRTRDGIAAAYRRRLEQGIPLPTHNKGRKFETVKAAAAKCIIKQHSKQFGGTLSDAECIKIAGCSRNSYYKYKAELKAAQLAAADPETDPAAVEDPAQDGSGRS